MVCGKSRHGFDQGIESLPRVWDVRFAKVWVSLFVNDSNLIDDKQSLVASTIEQIYLWKAFNRKHDHILMLIRLHVVFMNEVVVQSYGVLLSWLALHCMWSCLTRRRFIQLSPSYQVVHFYIVMWFRICRGRWDSGLSPFRSASPFYSSFSLSLRYVCKLFGVMKKKTDWMSTLKTTYKRKVNTKESEKSRNLKDPEKQSIEDVKASSIGSSVPARKSYVSELKIWNGTFSSVSIFKLFFRPFPFLLSPVVSFMSNPDAVWKIHSIIRLGSSSFLMGCKPCG